MRVIATIGALSLFGVLEMDDLDLEVEVEGLLNNAFVTLWRAEHGNRDHDLV